MMVELIVTCGATVSCIMDEYRAWTGERLLFEKLWPGDPRGEYGWYVVHLSPRQAQVVAHRHSSKIKKVDGTAPINAG